MKPIKGTDSQITQKKIKFSTRLVRFSTLLLRERMVETTYCININNWGTGEILLSSIREAETNLSFIRVNSLLWQIQGCCAFGLKEIPWFFQSTKCGFSDGKVTMGSAKMTVLCEWYDTPRKWCASNLNMFQLFETVLKLFDNFFFRINENLEIG